MKKPTPLTDSQLALLTVHQIRNLIKQNADVTLGFGYGCAEDCVGLGRFIVKKFGLDATFSFDVSLVYGIKYLTVLVYDIHLFSVTALKLAMQQALKCKAELLNSKALTPRRVRSRVPLPHDRTSYARFGITVLYKVVMQFKRMGLIP